MVRQRDRRLEWQLRNFGLCSRRNGGRQLPGWRASIGVEGDGDWADASGFGTFTSTSLCAGGCLTANTWLSTVRGRVGYAFDRYLVYATAGAAFGDIRANFSNGPISRSTE